MENLIKFQKNLDNLLNEYRSQSRELTSGFSALDLTEYSKLNIALQFLINNKTVATLPSSDAFLAYLDNGKADVLTLAPIQAEVINAVSKIIVNANVLEDMVNNNDDMDKSAKAKAKQKLNNVILQANAVYANIIPDYLVNARTILNGAGADTRIIDEQNYQIFDINEFFNGIKKSAKQPPIFEVRTLGDKQFRRSNTAVNKLNKVVKDNVSEFASLIPAISEAVTKAEKAYYHNLKSIKAEIPMGNVAVRSARRQIRVANKSAEIIPSYLDFFASNNQDFLSFEEFKQTPTFKMCYPFKTEDEYKSFIKSSEFASLISHMETPAQFKSKLNYDTFVTSKNLKKAEKQLECYYSECKEEFAEWKKSVFPLEVKKEGNTKTYKLSTSGSDYVVPSEAGFEYVGSFAKETIFVPSKYYRKLKKLENQNITVSVCRAENEKLQNITRRIGAGVLALSILFNATGYAVKEGVEEIIDTFKKGEEPITTPNNPQKPDNSTNTEIKDNEEDIRDNPAEEYEPSVDNSDENGVTNPNIPSEPQGPEQPSEPQQPSIEDSKPEYDQPDEIVPDENTNIQGDRENEGIDDEFFFD